MLPAGSTLTGIDREMKSLAEATRRSELLGQLPIRFEYMPGDAMVIASPDQGFDLVTCQTLLIHLDRPQDALAEMLRVTKAGGWILCAEPNNLASALSFDSTAWANDLDSLMAGAELQYRVELGKARLHEGFSSAGELVAGWLAAMNVESLQVYLSDKALAMWPPYATPEMAEALRYGSRNMVRGRRRIDVCGRREKRAEGHLIAVSV